MRLTKQKTTIRRLAIPFAVLGCVVHSWSCGGRTELDPGNILVEANSGGTGQGRTSPVYASGGSASVGTSDVSSTVATVGGMNAVVASPPVNTSSSCLSVNNNYAINEGPELAGYAYTFTTQQGNNDLSVASISPSCDQTGCSPPFPSNALCASGVVPASPNRGIVAGIGFNVSQPETSYNLSPAYSTTLPSDSLQATLLVNTIGGLLLNIRFIGVDGTVFCQDIRAGDHTSSVNISWSPSCSSDSAANMSPSTPITAIQLVVPSDDSRDIAFDFCLLCIGIVIIPN